MERLVIIGCGDLGLGLAEELRGQPGWSAAIHGTTTTDARREVLAMTGVTPHQLRLPDTTGLPELLAPPSTLLLTLAPRRGASHRDTYGLGVEAALGAARGSGVEHLIYVSATTVYGQDDGSWVDEDSPTEPLHERGRALLAAERLAAEGGEALRFPTTILRLSGIWSETRGPGRMLERFAGRERTDGDAYLNLVHREDVILALAHLVRQPHPGLLNLSDDHPTLRRDYYDPLVAAAGLPPIRWLPSPAKARGKRVANARIKELLGGELRYPRHT